MSKNKINKNILLIFLSILLLNCQAANNQNVEQLKNQVAIPDQKGMTVKGCITDENAQPAKGVVVNDGKNFTTTDKNGYYYLPSDLSRQKFVRICIPAEFEIEKTVVSSFYAPLSEKEGINQRNFKLKRRTKACNSFAFLALSDPQVKTESDMRRLENEAITDLRAYLKSNLKQTTLLMTLGDNVFDTMQQFADYKSLFNSLGVTVFSTIGNHDFNLNYADLERTPNPDMGYGEAIYETFFGPTDYSFNMGKIHIITMKDIDYSGNKKYIEQFTPAQLEWLKKDLSYTTPGTTVFLNIHAPTSNKSANGSGNTRNTQALLDILKDYKVHIFAGHTHFYENQEPADGVYEHNIGAVCGAWWAGDVNRCGAPNGYLIVDVNNTEVKWHYKATGKSINYQFRIYKPGEFATQAQYIVANVWDYDSKWQIKWYSDNNESGNMERFDDEDQDYINMKNGKKTGYHTFHLFRIAPPAGAKTITVEANNRFGEKYTQTIHL